MAITVIDDRKEEQEGTSFEAPKDVVPFLKQHKVKKGIITTGSNDIGRTFLWIPSLDDFQVILIEGGLSDYSSQKPLSVSRIDWHPLASHLRDLLRCCEHVWVHILDEE